MDATANQTLTPAEIAALPTELTGAGVIAALEAASTSFAGKTEFSQARFTPYCVKDYTHTGLKLFSCNRCEVYMRTDTHMY